MAQDGRLFDFDVAQEINEHPNGTATSRPTRRTSSYRWASSITW
ncbi:MAG: hypothetical protein OXC95_04080 [Dehalococcoidia bacterium]|nr:hypothetical protein [Dehalococcoidia bacterium]